jgi:hypothetical protein
MPDVKDGCVVWVGASVRGYGQKWNQGRTWLVHRLVWTRTIGPIPERLCVLHRCDCRSCYNVDHLFLGTYADNYMDMKQKGRSKEGEHQKRRTHCPRGHPYDEENTRYGPSASGGRTRYCRSCERARNRAYRKKHGERERARHRAYRCRRIEGEGE